MSTKKAHVFAFFLLTTLLLFSGKAFAVDATVFQVQTECSWPTDSTIDNLCSVAHVGEPVRIFAFPSPYRSDLVDYQWDAATDDLYVDNSFAEAVYSEPGIYNISVSAMTEDNPPQLVSGTAQIEIKTVTPPQVEAGIEVISQENQTLVHRLWYEMDSGDPAFYEFNPRYQLGGFECTVNIDYGDGTSSYGSGVDETGFTSISSGNAYLFGDYFAGDVFSHTYPAAGNYEMVISANCEAVEDYGILDGPTLTYTQNIVIDVADTFTVDFENTEPDLYASLSVDGFVFAPTFNTEVIVFDDDYTNSVSSRWNDTLQLSRADGQSFDLLAFEYMGRWQGVTSYVDIIGTQSDGTRLYEQFVYDDSEWLTKTLNWSDLIQVDFVSPEGRVQMDNFVFAGLPQPATLLDFEGQSVEDLDSLTVNGYNFIPLKSSQISIFEVDTLSISPGWNDTLRLTRENGEVFNLEGFDLSSYWDGVTGTLDVIGYRMDGSTITSSVSFVSGVWESHTLNWTDLIQVDFVTIDGRLLLDNLAVSP